MKKLLPALMFIVCFGFTASAQQTVMKQTIDLADSKNHLGKIVTLCDMGGTYPNQKFTIAVKGNKLQLDWVNLKNKSMCVTGVLELYKNTLQIIASEPSQVTVSK